MHFLSPANFTRFSFRHVLADSVLLLLSLYLSLWLRTGAEGIDQHLPTLNRLALIFVALRVVILLALGVYRSMWRYTSTGDAQRLALAVIASVPVFISVTYFGIEIGFLPRSFFVIDGLLSLMLLMTLRLGRRWVFERQMKPKRGHVALGQLIIYGAEQNGRLLAQRLLSDPLRKQDVLGFIDDDPRKQDKLIQGLPVLGSRADLEELLERTGCTDLVVAITKPSPDLMRAILLAGRKYKVRVQRISELDSISAQPTLYQPLELKDLLNRPAAAVDVPLLKNLIENKVVLVTGAGGSIGSELSRQIARLKPSRLLLLDHAELNLFTIDQELRPQAGDFSSVIPLLCDLKDEGELKTVFQKYRPEIVFHAAAYKHVHLVEANVPSAVHNNVGATWNLLKLCEAFQVERFVLISSDKAVNPVGAMGATKRVCELLTTHMGLKTKRPYSSVRFGNVLGSSGSLIPTLENQIRGGGPVTLTHPDMTRYFMLIPEAVSLVLMSATLSQAGDVNVLKMGEPIRIQDLAKNLMVLMGFDPEEIGIAFTGIRPGEKLYEELYITGEELTTRHAEILTMPRGDLGHTSLNVVLEAESLLSLARAQDPTVLSSLLNLANQKSANISPTVTARN